MNMNRGPEAKGYEHLTRQLAQQFADGENVNAGDLAYLRDFSEESHRHYELLMDRVGDMYEADSVDGTQETRARRLGSSVVNLSDK